MTETDKDSMSIADALENQPEITDKPSSNSPGHNSQDDHYDRDEYRPDSNIYREV